MNSYFTDFDIIKKDLENIKNIFKEGKQPDHEDIQYLNYAVEQAVDALEYRKNRAKYSWPENLLCDIPMRILDKPDEETMKSINYLLGNCLDDEQRKVILKHYKDGLSISQIASEENCSEDRISFLIESALDELDLPEREKMIRAGYERYMHFHDIKKKVEKEEKELIDKELNIIEKQNYIRENHRMPRENPEKLTLDDLNLSVRAYNCLKRAGIDTLAELMTMKDYEIREIRNMGKKSYYEVMSVIYDYRRRIYNQEQSLQWIYPVFTEEGDVTPETAMPMDQYVAVMSEEGSMDIRKFSMPDKSVPGEEEYKNWHVQAWYLLPQNPDDLPPLLR